MNVVIPLEEYMLLCKRAGMVPVKNKEVGFCNECVHFETNWCAFHDTRCMSTCFCWKFEHEE